ncbi:uncharacterized protein LOC115755418 [Rhodamnia argentea]|uniref:Uncharacterized protein LOC115755418 n=1 Tax=Rhodamnia argentea TaxID=178133 RepID=A0A8B8QTX9_9MYRT|nr:uncharacterized protein LOC115755418 [Rhodamnia argentea]
MAERDGDARVQTVICLFFLCVVTGGVFLCLYIFLPETESNSWFYLAGIVLEAIPWCFWLLGYLYSCFRPRPANDPSKGFSARVNSTAVAPVPAPVNNPQSPAKDSPHSEDNDDDEQRRVHFGAVIVMGNEEQNGHQSGVEGLNNDALGNGEDGGDHSHSNTGSTSSTLNDHDLSIGSRESEMPLTLGASSCK